MNDFHQAVKRVLVIDDDPSFADFACDALERMKIEAVSASTTAAALAAMVQFQADAVLLDIRLGDENGLDFLPEFKKKYPEVPVIILTGIGYESNTMKTAMRQGASGYFSKENDFQDLAQLLNHLLRKQNPIRT